jgi:cephalosporin hydroxylase
MTTVDNFAAERVARVQALGDDERLGAMARQWMDRAQAGSYSYNFDWLGRPVIQYPQDIVAFQELVWQCRPDVVIETGIARGGSLMLSASLLAMLDLCECAEAGESLDPRKPKRRVLGVDIDIRSHNREAILAHPLSPYIEMIEGSSVADDVISQVRHFAAGHERVLVALDSNHTHEHVAAELQVYAPLVTVGSYCIVYDTVIEDLPADSIGDRPWGPGNSPKTAVWEYLEDHPEFEIDKSIPAKLGITVAPDGFLRRVA